MCQTTSSPTSVSGRTLYHTIWDTVRSQFHDESRLKEWSLWEHRFDDQIDGEDSALNHARTMLASLNDSYTLLTAASPSAKSENASDAKGGEKEPDVFALLLPNGIAYLRIMSFDDPNIVSLLADGMAKIASCDGLILDLRHNIGGLIHQAAECCELFFLEGPITTVESRVENGMKARHAFLTPDAFCWTDVVPGEEPQTQEFERRQPIVYGKPIAVLLSPKTASAAELFAAAIVANGISGSCVSVGTDTVGKGIGQKEFDLGKVKLRVSYCRFLAPTGEWFGDCGQTVSNGIEPMILVADDHGPEGLEVAADELRKMLKAEGK